MTNGTTATFTVKNGAKGDKGDKGDTGGIQDVAESSTKGYITITKADGTKKEVVVGAAGDFLPLRGGTLTGALTITDPNGFRMVQGDYGFIFRNDGTNFWLLPTKKGDPYGSYNSNVAYTRINLDTGVLYGAVWNDYAEYRQASTKEPGRCVIEKGDDTLELSTARLLPGANIVSDTFGFAIGETKNCTTPIAVSGRVLAYPYEPRDQFKAGDAVCSGPNGTVSIMTREEIREYPERIIGTVSSVPTYEKWGSGDVQVNGRIWIKVK